MLALFLRELIRIVWLVALVAFVVGLIVGTVALGGLAAISIFFRPEG